MNVEQRWKAKIIKAVSSIGVIRNNTPSAISADPISTIKVEKGIHGVKISMIREIVSFSGHSPSILMAPNQINRMDRERRISQYV
ncbi:MAG: hypothetical protein ACK4NC_04100 [Candidatus Gracilibacteria bacterium]